MISFLVMLGEISLKKGMSFQVSVPRRLEAPLSILLQQVPDRSNLCLEKWLILQLWNRDDPGAITSYHLHTQTMWDTLSLCFSHLSVLWRSSQSLTQKTYEVIKNHTKS